MPVIVLKLGGSLMHSKELVVWLENIFSRTRDNIIIDPLYFNILFGIGVSYICLCLYKNYTHMNRGEIRTPILNRKHIKNKSGKKFW